MSEVIKNWIAHSIGIVMDMTPEIFAKDTMDGTIIAKILLHYKIIGQSKWTSIVPTTKSSVAFTNLKRIRLWLQEVYIECSEEDLFEISQLKASYSMKFFYQLYLALHNKTQTYFIARRREMERLHPTDTRFSVTHVELLPEMPTLPDNPLSEPLVQRNDVVQWNENKYDVLREQYIKLQEKYSNYIRDKFGVEYGGQSQPVVKKPEELETFEELNAKFPDEPDLSYEELLEQQKCAEEMARFEQNPKEAKRILNDIKVKRRKEMKEKDLTAHQQKVLLMELWDNLLKNQEKEFENVISLKMLKQSLFEKQMVTKMAEVKRQKENMMYHRKFMDAEVLKKREEEFLEGVFLRDKAKSDQKYNYYFERDRALELHRRLYREKLRLKAHRIRSTCEACVNDLVDVAIKSYEYKDRFGMEVPPRVRHEWANLFIKGQPIFDIMRSVDALMENNENLPEDLEEIYQKEFDRQNKLDEADFDDYVNYDWPWLVSELLEDSEGKLVTVDLGMNVLGYNVHRALLAKYPKLHQPKKHDLPNVTISACINGLTDTTIIPVLQKLVNHKGVRIIELQEAINYCLEGYKEEVSTEYIDKNLITESELALEDLMGKPGGAYKVGLQKGDKGARGSKGMSQNPSMDVPKFADKNVQTPKIYPCEEIVLSHRGDLGRTAYDLLNLGEQLTDHLLVAMLIEFLKSLKSMKGWALINYPTSFSQAVLLEESLTGFHVPDLPNNMRIACAESIGDIADLEYRESILDLEDQYKSLRKSKLVPNPDPPRKEPYFDTYLTAYIHVMLHPEKELSDTIALDEDEEEPPVDLLEKFYSDQGCNYAFYYKTFEVDTIKHLAKLIIGDYSIPRKNSLELFGDTVLYIQQTLRQSRATPGLESKAEKQTVRKPTPPEKPGAATEAAKQKTDAKGGVVIVAVTYEDKATQIPEIDEEIVEIVPPRKEPRPGEPYWQYSDLTFPENFKVSLGVFWENLEKVYISDFREIFFIKRVLMNAVIPYLSYVRQHMNEFLDRPDNKQTNMYEFQNMYNEIDGDLREDEEFKAEMHCRIAEFREKLWQICDFRMKEAEEERHRLIHDNWITIQSSELSNNCVTAMQLEMDRCCDSIQFLIDWYSGIITKMPSDQPLLQKSLLSKLEFSRISTGAVETTANLSTIAFLTSPETKVTETSFHTHLDAALHSSMQGVSKWKRAAIDVAAKLASYFKPGVKPAAKDDKGAKKLGEAGKLPKFLEPDEDVKEAGTRLIDELNCAINGEALRAQLRLDMIKERGKKDLYDVMNSCKGIFIEIYQDIHKRYHKEIESVDTACEVLAQAVEAETQLQPELLLAGDKFYVEPNVLLFPDPLPAPPPPVKETSKDGIFTIVQLEGLTNILMDLAPNASMPERAFVFLIQDMIVNNTEDGKDSMVPIWWQQLRPKQVAFVSREIFGDVEYIDWKDFIIYNMCVKFPTEGELLEAREQFRENDPDLTETVKDYQFNNITFWFESCFETEEPEEMLRLGSIKRLLLKLFKINEDTMSYTALLLAFCKDYNPVLGFAKALTLILGKRVCWDKAVGEVYVSGVMDQRFLDEQAELQRQRDHEEAIAISQSVTETLIDKTVHLCDSVILEDYVSEEFKSEDEEEHQLEETENTETWEYPSRGFRESELMLPDDVFSNIDIGFEPTYDSPKVYFLPYEILLTALTAGMPWHARAQTEKNRSFRDRLEVIYARCKNEKFNGSVLTHELLNDYYFIDMLTRSFKFIVRCPPKIVVKLVTDNFSGSST